jgi:quinol-cytochrome oxidoreductase complex cytochrome b subunit
LGPEQGSDFALQKSAGLPLNFHVGVVPVTLITLYLALFIMHSVTIKKSRGNNGKKEDINNENESFWVEKRPQTKAMAFTGESGALLYRFAILAHFVRKKYSGHYKATRR